MGEGGVGAFDGASPEPGDHGQLFAFVRFEVGPVFDHFFGDFDGWVQVSDPAERFVTHPLAVVAHVFGQALGAFPFALEEVFVFARDGVHGWHAGELGWDLDHGLVDKHGHGVEVAGVGFQAQALGFERDGAAAGERVVQAGHLVWVEQVFGLRVLVVECANLAPGSADLFTGWIEHIVIGGVFPLDKSFDQVVEFVAAAGPGASVL